MLAAGAARATGAGKRRAQRGPATLRMARTRLPLLLLLGHQGPRPQAGIRAPHAAAASRVGGLCCLYGPWEGKDLGAVLLAGGQFADAWAAGRAGCSQVFMACVSTACWHAFIYVGTLCLNFVCWRYPGPLVPCLCSDGAPFQLQASVSAIFLKICENCFHVLPQNVDPENLSFMTFTLTGLACWEAASSTFDFGQMSLCNSANAPLALLCCTFLPPNKMSNQCPVFLRPKKPSNPLVHVIYLTQPLVLLHTEPLPNGS